MALAACAAVALLLTVLAPRPAQAHRVNVFAYVDGGTVRAESSFSSGNPAMNAAIHAEDAATGAVLAKGTTNGKGEWSFPVPPQVPDKGVKVVIDAGGGHRGEWTVEPDEFAQAAGAGPAATPSEAAPAVTTAPAATAGVAPTVPAATRLPADQAELARVVEAAVDRALERRLGGLMRTLTRMESGPGLTEILGGIGWIFGLMGVAAYFRYRKN
jgi:nickel transport protein